VYGRSGKRAEALAVLKELEEQAGRRYVSRYHVAAVYYGLGDEQAALREIEALVADRSGVVVWIAIDPHTSWLRGNPRFDALVHRLGLPAGPPPGDRHSREGA
jgi:hypothetical protein